MKRNLNRRWWRELYNLEKKINYKNENNNKKGINYGLRQGKFKRRNKASSSSSSSSALLACTSPFYNNKKYSNSILFFFSFCFFSLSFLHYTSNRHHYLLHLLPIIFSSSSIRNYNSRKILRRDFKISPERRELTQTTREKVK